MYIMKVLPTVWRLMLCLPVNIYILSSDAEMPEHDLEPPRFSRRSLERILNDWTAVKAMIMSGKKGTSSPDVVYEDQLYLDSQSGTARLDKFTHTLLVKCSVEVRSSRV